MRVKKPAPNTIIYRGKRYNWVSNYVFKTDAQKRQKSLERQGAKAIVVGLDGNGFSKYAVYVQHNLRGILAR